MQLQQSQRRQKKYRKKKTGGFAKAVMSVVNKKAESKQFTSLGSANYAASTDWKTWNITNGLNQGTSTSQRVGDKIFMKQIRLSLVLRNANSIGGIDPNSALFRVVIFRGKYDYSITNYPSTEVFEVNSGGSASPNELLARIDTNQVTPLYDKVHTLNASNIGGVQVVNKHILKTLKVNKSFMFKDDDNYGKNSNLYLGIVPYIYGIDGKFLTQHNISFTYTDA